MKTERRLRMRSLAVALFLALSSCARPAGVAEKSLAVHAAPDSSPVTFSRRSSTFGSSWLTYQFSPTHNAVFAASRLDAVWSVRFDNKINGGLAVVGDKLYTVNFDHAAYALDDRDGKMLWATGTGNVVMSTPVISRNIVVIGTGHDGWLNPNGPDPQAQIWGRPEGDALYALSGLDGHVLWRFKTVGDDMASAAIADGTVVFANGDLHAYGLDLKTGKLKWRVPLQGVASMDSSTADGDVAFIGTCRVAPRHCETDAIDVRNGGILWRAGIGSADAAAAVGHGLVFTNMLNLDTSGTYNQGGTSVIAALDETTGKIRWTWTSAPGPCSFAGSGEHEIAGTLADQTYFDSIGCGSEVVALNAFTGVLRWRIKTWATVKMSPVVYAGRVYFGDTDGILYVADERTGKVIRTISFDQTFTTAPPIIVGHTIFLACSTEIYAFPLDGGINPLDIPTRHENDNPIVNDTGDSAAAAN